MKFSNENWDDVSKLEVKSTTPLETDTGRGGKAIIRVYEFAANPEAFKQHKPTKQELFNSHRKGIEMQLWADGFSVMPEVEPRVLLSKKKTNYRIFVGAKPRNGMVMVEKTKTLSEIAHNK